MNYEQALAYIHGTLRFGSKLGLERINVLLDLMGNPHKKLDYIHVAGTNGKGSTTAMITSILKQQGYKVGMYTSPYIEEFTERIQINGKNIDKDHLAKIITWIKEVIEIMIKQGYDHPTEFEMITAAAFQYYYEEKCNIVVLEVGMGGRFDATNVIERPLVSVITSISLDHTEHLGKDVEHIAFEKSGIIKQNSMVVVYPEQQPGVIDVIKQTAENVNSDINVVEKDYLEVISDTLNGIIFSYKGDVFKIPLLGKYQVLNAITAITVIDVLQKRYGITVSKENLKIGLEKVRWSGRLEIMGSKPLIIIDGAHNISAIQMLKESLQHYAKDKKIIFVMGMLRDKDYKQSIGELAPMAEVMIATTPNNDRALPANQLASIMKIYCSKVYWEENIEKAVKLGIENAGDNDIICYCGSLYLIGDIRKILRMNFGQDIM